MKRPLPYLAKHALRAFIIAAATVAIFAALQQMLNTDWMEAENIVSEHVQFSDLYFRLHAHTEPPTYNGRCVYVVDVHPYQSREEVTELFEKIAAAQPYVVALDMIFPSYSLTDSSADRRLVDAIRKLPNPIVALETRNDQVIRSFFADNPHVCEAAVNLSTSIIRTWNSTQIINNDTLLTFAAAIAQKLNIPVPNPDKEWLIDFSIVDTIPLRPDPNCPNLDILHDQIVIVGDVEDLRDTRLIPFSYRTSMKTSGVMVHKQIVQSIMSKHKFHTISKIWSWILTAIIIWLFLFSDFAINGMETIPESQKKAINYLTNCGIMILLVIITDLIFWTAGCYINIWNVIFATGALWVGQVLWESGSALFWISKQIVKQIHWKKGKKK